MQSSIAYNPSKEIASHISLVKWQHKHPKVHYNMMTIHSLTIDDNPMFVKLKAVVEKYNQEKEPDRIRYQQVYIGKLYQMLSEVSRIKLVQNQLEYLEKIYNWALKEKIDMSFDDSLRGKSRPATASTRTRPQTGVSRALTGVARPQSGTSRPGTATLQSRTYRPPSVQQSSENVVMKKTNPKIDYSKLQPGDQQFYAGIRTIHPEIEPPKKRLKQYERNRMYQDEEIQSDVQIIQLEEKEEQKQKEPIKPIEVSEEQLMQEIERAEGQEGDLLEGQDGAQEVDVNVDDIPLEGEEDGLQLGEAEPEEVEVIDKLRPRLKAYGEKVDVKISNKRKEAGEQEIRLQRQYYDRKNEEDKVLAQLKAEWAQRKGRATSQMKRRAESARMITKKIGISMRPEKQDPPPLFVNCQNFINFQNVMPVQIVSGSKNVRPSTAFTSDRVKPRQELITNNFISSRLDSHIVKPQTVEGKAPQFERGMTTHGQNPKKKTFEQILREAQERVIRDAEEEVDGVKQAFAKNKISLGANRIAKSITHYNRQVQEWQGGVITGMGMIKNPFIKIAKKKKKKKSKK